MRTTVDLPEDLHRQARSIARDSQKTFSEVIADLIRRGLRAESAESLGRSPVTGLPTLDLGTVITSESVRELEDDV